MRTWPSTRVAGMMSFIRLSVRRNVLLPQPDGPMKAVTRFDCIRIVMPSSASLRAVVEVQVLDVDLRRALGRRGLAAANHRRATRGSDRA